MSKRSYRRLAVVAGTALALGSMAPAMAIRINAAGNGAAGASIETIDVSETLDNVQSNVVLPTNLAFSAVGDIRSVVRDARPVLRDDVFGLLDGVECVADAGITAAAGLNVRALGTVGVGLGGISANVAGLAAAPVTLTTGATDCLDGLQSDVLATVSHGEAVVGAVGGIATGTAHAAVTYAGTLPGAVTAPLFLGDLLKVSAGGGATAGALLTIF